MSDGLCNFCVSLFCSLSDIESTYLNHRLSRVEENRECILDELALVAESLGKMAILDLKAVSVRLSAAAKHHKENFQGNSGAMLDNDLVAGTPSSAVSLSTSNSELKLLR